MDVDDFTHEVPPHRKRSRLLKFKEQIGTLKRLGYSDMQVRHWLTQNGCQVSRENVRRFIKRHLPELSAVSGPEMPDVPAPVRETDRAARPIHPSECEPNGSSRKESAAERILRQTREQRDKAAQHLFKHDKTGNNH